MQMQDIKLSEVCPTAQKMLDEGYTLITQTVVSHCEGDNTLLYHYGKGLEEVHYRLEVKAGKAIPSITPIFFSALLVENENQDLFGLKYDGLVVDFNRTLYYDEAGDPTKAAFCTISTYKNSKAKE